MSTDKEIIVIGDSGAGRLATLKAELHQVVMSMFGVDEFTMQAKVPKELIEYKAPPVFEIPDLIVNSNTKPKRKGKTPRKKQNGYF